MKNDRDVQLIYWLVGFAMIVGVLWGICGPPV